MDYKYLNSLNSPEDVKSISESEIPVLCKEIRDCLINTISANGGHLASNLGVVELTVALHRVFDSPEDSILFDVGHQSYTHKLLTGRYNRFASIRTEGGISGFMKPSESVHDPFITGHSSNSISAAYGIYKAKQLQFLPGTAVAVVGDGAMTGGMIYEALNNAATDNKNFIVILNDNKMSISNNVGALARYLNAIRSSKGYNSFKRVILNFLNKIPVVGQWLRKSILRSKIIIKSAFYDSNIFEGFGFNYLGPVNGHDVKKLEQILKIAKSKDGPVLVHVVTVKGKGYDFAESSPHDYHGVSPFNADTGAKFLPKQDFSSVFGDALCQLAEHDSRICAITAAMSEGTGLTTFSEKFRDRFFDVGIAEQHAVTFAAALASKGMKPYFAVYSSFLQRGFDQMIHDAAIAGWPLTICVDRAGFVGEDGETHHGIFDAAFLSEIPGIRIYSPSYYSELIDVLNRTSISEHLTVVRYPRGTERGKDTGLYDFSEPFTVINGNIKSDTVIITYGRIFADALKAAERLKLQKINVSIIKINRICPIVPELIKTLASFNNIFFFEEGIKSGGIGEHLASMMLEAGIKPDYFCLRAVDNSFVKAAPVPRLLNLYGLDADSMVEEIGRYFNV